MPSTHHGILIHAVFSTKQRFKLLNPSWRGDLFSYIGGTVKNHKAFLLAAGGIEDHVHLLLKTHPSFAISETIKLIKGNSSKWINATNKISARFEWQKGYGAFSVSQSMIETVKTYIDKQKEHHTKQTFENEYFAMLRKHRIDFDERFVFDDQVVG